MINNERVRMIARLEAENATLKEEILRLKGAVRADDERLLAASARAGIDYFGCDTADSLVDEILDLRARLKHVEDVEEKYKHLDDDLMSAPPYVAFATPQQRCLFALWQAVKKAVGK